MSSASLQSQLDFTTSKKQASSTSTPPAKTWEFLEPTAIFDEYWHFASARQEAFFRRFENQKPPWSDDEILATHKFTNAYRASDRVSQYLIKNVIYSGIASFDEVFFRVLLFKFFNKIETWELLSSALGALTWRDFTFEAYDKVLGSAIGRGQRIYSAAYIMPTGGRGTAFSRKHHLHLHLLEKMMRDELPKRLLEARDMREGFNHLRAYPTIGDFLAYQYITDLNYSECLNYTEMEFVVAGPGAKDGICKCFKNVAISYEEIIQMMALHQEHEFARLGLHFRDLWGRSLQLIDCQNLFCEISKYSRVSHPEIAGLSGRTRIKQKFRANCTSLPYWYPPKWGINDGINR